MSDPTQWPDHIKNQMFWANLDRFDNEPLDTVVVSETGRSEPMRRSVAEKVASWATFEKPQRLHWKEVVFEDPRDCAEVENVGKLNTWLNTWKRAGVDPVTGRIIDYEKYYAHRDAWAEKRKAKRHKHLDTHLK